MDSRTTLMRRKFAEKEKFVRKEAPKTTQNRL